MQSGKVDPGTVGVNRPQFCIYCGKEVFLPAGLNTHTLLNIPRVQELNNVNSELEVTIKEVRSELRLILIKRRKLIEKLGFAFEKVVANKESICEEIKNCLKGEITSGIISPRTIEQSCLPEWKKKTKPKLENEKISFSHHKSEEEEQRKIILDNYGNPVQDKAENNYSDSSPAVDFKQGGNGTAQQDKESLQRLHGIIRELVYENKKLRQEKDEVQIRLGEALELLQKQRESKQHQYVFYAEFPVDYSPLQNHMAQIFKSPSRQEVWFTVKIDANKKRVVSVQLGKKLLPQNDMETRDSNEQR